MNRKTVRLSRLTIGLLAALAAVPVLAQQTSASLGGRIAADTGQPVAGAQVTIVHVPSATSRTAVTDENGRYVARGLRVGGPYRITITKDGQTEVLEDVTLSLSDDNSIDAMLGRVQATDLGRVVATATAPSVFSSDAMGAGTNLEREQIESFASIQRNLQDYARLDPRISQTDKERGEISVAGQNTRYNSITIDGLTTNDTFGLEANNLPTERQPISIDAIEAVEINVSNYDVTQTGYTGANINAVTKSGTNEFHGSLYGTYRDSDMVRQTDDRGQAFNGFDDERLYGFTLGGPIIKDRLFFFVNYEDFKRTAPGVNLDLSDASRVNGVSLADIRSIQDISRNQYGIDVGGFSPPASSENTTEELLAKVDWNISDDHRASFRYNKTEQSFLEVRDFGSRRVSFDTHWYTQEKSFETFVGQLYSDWSDSFSTEFKLGYRTYDSEPKNFTRLPQVEINADGGTVYLGTERFRHANVLATDTFNAAAIGNLFLGDHEVKFGADYERNDIYNLFLESSLGRYRFNSVADYANGTYRDFTLRAPANGGLDSAAAAFELANIGLFVQDTWFVNSNLTLTAGLRVDVPQVDSKPAFNQQVLDTYGYRNDQTIDGNQLIQPRFGFNYTFDTALRSQVRGGVGLFQGAAASVWLANPFTNNGRTIDVYQDNSFTPGVDQFTLDPDNQPRDPANLLSGGDVDLLDPDLEQPSVWKANLAFDQELPWWGTVFTTELLLTKVNQAINYEHLNLGTPTIGPDGRNLYWGYDPATGTYNSSARGNRTAAERQFNDVLLASPTSNGRGYNLTVGFNKPMLDSWSWSAAYSHTYATEASPLTSSRAISNWDNRVSFNPNEARAGTANYEISDRFIGSVSYKHAFFADHDTQFTLFYEGRSGKPYSYAFKNDANGDGINDNDLFYIPTGPGDVVFLDPAEEAAFWEYIASDDYLSTHRGQVAQRNKADSPWVNTFDLRIRQELPGLWKGHESELVFDILNVGNLLNKDWGHVDEVGFPLSRGVASYQGIDPATGKYIYSFDGRPDQPFRLNTASRWSAQVTFRYKF